MAPSNEGPPASEVAAAEPSDADGLAALLSVTQWSSTPEGLGDALRRGITRGREAWPQLDVPPDELAAALGAAVAEVEDPIATIDGLSVGDLWLACACALGLRPALEAFDRLLAGLRPTLLRMGATPETVDDLLQQVRTRLLAASDDRPPRIRSYRGHGDLRSWLKVVVVRDATRAIRQEAGRATPSDEVDLLMDPQADPELAAMRGAYAAAFREAFGHALGQLSPRDRNVLRYHLLEGLSIDELGGIYRVHRATAARWLVRIRTSLYEGTRQTLMQRLAMQPAELDSVLRLIRSRLDASIARGLQDPA